MSSQSDIPPHSLPGSSATDRWARRKTRQQIFIAMGLVAPIVIFLPIWIGVPRLSAVGAVILSIQIASLRLIDHERMFDVLSQTVYGGGLATVAFATWMLGLPSVITVYFSSIILLAAAHISGVRSALVWAVPSVVLVSASVYFPPPVGREVGEGVVVGVRIATLLTILGFALRLRVDNDQQSAELMRLATIDTLTGLSNRAGLEGAIETELARSARDGSRGAVLFIDIDGLKRINDELGHAGGDDLLCTVARRIEGMTRRTDTCARLGGDEFILLLSSVRDEKSVERVARALVTKISEPCEVGGRELRPAVSVGIAQFDQSDEECDPEALIGQADAAMYAAKRCASNRVFKRTAVGFEEVV